ncbi:MAG: oligopeptide transporter, OPT family, partial [Acidobacteria bacterium]|nr:oligopeptide transporter, OPT family [Acidobacteriota bacterium]
AASVGEALVAGAIFTVPAFMMVEMGGARLWTSLRDHYLESVAILMAGGLLGVFFIVALRRPLTRDPALPFPESVASAEIVKAGEQGSDAPKYIFGAMGFAALLQILKSERGLLVMRESLAGFLPFPASVIRHFDLDRRPVASVTHFGGIPWSTPNLSPALLGIGYLIGPALASISFAGGILAWWVLIPLLLFFDPDLAARLGGAQADVASFSVWHNVVRPVAVGAMLVSAGYTLLGMRQAIAASFAGALAASAKAGGRPARERVDRDLPFGVVALASGALVAAITAIYHHFTGSVLTAAIAGIVMTVTGFLLSAVGGYLTGLVGSSNQPLSGLTLAALVLSALLLLAVGATGLAGTAAVLGVASVVACAVSVSGSLIQDLKAGQLLGGTPWKMQVVEIAAVVLLSAFLMLPIIALHEANLETGGIGGRALPAPQAGLMAQLSSGIVGGQMAWGLIAIGAAFGLLLILSGARAPMLLAVGMYLPFDTTAAIFAGGGIRWAAARRMARADEQRRARFEEKGTLLASGMIAGEAIMGILMAVLFLSGVTSLTRLLTGADTFPFYPAWGGWLSLAGFAAIAWVLIAIPARRDR